MEIISQLVGLAKTSGVSVVILLCAGAFGYFKLWPWWCDWICARETARENRDNKFLEALERRDEVSAANATAVAANAAALDRNTEVLRQITRSVDRINSKVNRE